MNTHNTYRGSGNTFAACHEIAKEIILETPVILYVAARIAHINNMMPMFLEILEEHSIEITRRERYKVWAGKSMVEFTSTEFVDNRIRHFKHNEYTLVYDNN